MFKMIMKGDADRNVRVSTDIVRRDYDLIKQKFEVFVSIFKTRNVAELSSLVKKDIHAYFSVVKSQKDGGQHSIFGIKDFFLDIPKTDDLDYVICNYICRFKDGVAQQSAEVELIAKNTNGEKFQCIATFANSWIKVDDEWIMEELRMDVQAFDSSLIEEFKKVWYFEESIAVLSGTVHLPCIFPELDSPYSKIRDSEDVLNEEEKVKECLSKFSYGIDWIMFRYLKEILADNFKNDDKRHFIAYTKFARQRYRYSSHAYYFKSMEISDNTATAVVETLIPDVITRTVQFIKNDNKWQILSID